MLTLKKIKLRKASREDEITAEFLSQERIKKLLATLNAAVTNKEIPSDWKTDMILSIFKNKNKKMEKL